MLASAPEVARDLADVLEASGMPYAIGGALALAVWGFPRATNDVDLDLFVSLDRLDQALDVLQRGGCVIDREAALSSAAQRGDFALGYRGMRVDVFIPSIPLYESARQRIRRGPLRGREAWYLAAEDLAIFKMLFFRTKDILDVERLVAFRAETFDRGYVLEWLEKLVGESDERVARWSQLLKDVDAAVASGSDES